LRVGDEQRQRRVAVQPVPQQGPRVHRHRVGDGQVDDVRVAGQLGLGGERDQVGRGGDLLGDVVAAEDRA
jgi:hypothetical protein